MNNNFGMNFNNGNNMVNLNNNFNKINQPMEFSNFGMPKNGFSSEFLPQQNIMKEENYYNITFASTNGAKITCHVLADSSIENMIQILKIKLQ